MRKASLLAALLMAASVALAQGTYTQIDYPGAILTDSYGINGSGDIVGTYEDAGGNFHGFLLDGGTYTTIDYPGSTYTLLTAINDVGEIIGYIGGDFGPYVGFAYSQQTEDFTVIDPPKGNYAFPLAINDNGEIGGGFAHGAANALTGFGLVGSRYMSVSPPQSRDVYVFGVSAKGTLFGSAVNFNGADFYFAYSQGQYSDFVIPNAPENLVNAVNPQGTAFVGQYNPSTATVGFVYQDKTLTALQFPGSSFTQALGINRAGEVVGTFGVANGSNHGFLWTPPAGAAKK
jgi:probable HAF family extracellular repeat protein